VIGDLLTPLDLAGWLLTLDALHTTKKTARLITGALEAHYMLILKGNQPLALQAAQALLSGTDTEFADSTDSTDDRGHARTERRTLRVAACDDTLFPRCPASVAAAPRHRRSRRRAHQQRDRLRHRQPGRRAGHTGTPQPLRQRTLDRGKPSTL